VVLTPAVLRQVAEVELGVEVYILAAAEEDMGFEDCSRSVVAVHTLGKKESPMLPGVVDEVGDRHQVVEAGRRLWQPEVLTVEPDAADSGVRWEPQVQRERVASLP